jgi:hypothetical protein
MSNVATFPKPARKSRPSAITARSPSLRRRLSRQRVASYGVGAVALVLTGLSLSHLAEGIESLTKCSPAMARAMATGIDMGFISLELGQLSIQTESLRKQVSRFAKPAVVGTLVVSALINGYQFAAPATGIPFEIAAGLLGSSIPALVYVLTRVSCLMWIDSHR